VKYTHWEWQSINKVELIQELTFTPQQFQYQWQPKTSSITTPHSQYFTVKKNWNHYIFTTLLAYHTRSWTTHSHEWAALMLLRSLYNFTAQAQLSKAKLNCMGEIHGKPSKADCHGLELRHALRRDMVVKSSFSKHNPFTLKLICKRQRSGIPWYLS
jgi:hypothetical protein